MGGGFEHPRTILAVRVLLYFGLIVVLGVLAMGVIGYLFVVAAFGGIALLAGSSPGALPMVAMTLVGLVVATTVGLGTTVVVRWADRRVVAADRRPDPVEALTERYVAAELDEVEFERRLEGVLARQKQRDWERQREREYERH